MTRSGVPDYGMYAALENMGNLVDYGELAARLGSIVAFNREGNVIFWDDFEHTPLKWIAATTGSGSTVGYSAEEALSGGQSVKLQTGALYADMARVVRSFPRFADGKWGLEIAFSNEDKNYKLRVLMYVDLITHYYMPHINIDFNAGKIELLSGDGNWYDVVTNVEFTDDINLFHHFKVVIDTETDRYCRIILNRNEYNVEEYPMQKIVTPTGEGLKVYFTARTFAAVSAKLYLDNFILTQNEP